MTPKEKAEELVSKFSNNGLRNWSAAKQCALIAVDEIINRTPLTSYPTEYCKKHRTPVGSKNWWQEVKQEIEKL